MKTWILKLMSDARSATENYHVSIFGQFATKAYDQARKQIIHLPRSVAPMAASHIPVVGSLATIVVEQVVAKVVEDRQNARRTNAALQLASAATNSNLREAAKWDIKDLKGVISSIDAGMPALREALTALEAASNDYYNTFDDADCIDAARTLARATYEVEHHENSLLALVEIAKDRIGVADQFLKKSRETTLAIQDQLTDDLDCVGIEYVDDDIIVWEENLSPMHFNSR
jgi:ABC-type transporter Mla subunit MlaD